MDSAQFCGQTCHTVMEPEYTAYRRLASLARLLRRVPHRARRALVRQGQDLRHAAGLRRRSEDLLQADSLARARLPAGARHLRALPLASEVHRRRLLVRTKYADDEKNTPSTTVLLLKIGGRTTEGLVGIHGRHLADVERIEYVSTDGRRQVIPLVTYIDDAGKKVEYVSTDANMTTDQLAKGERRKMDCMDCHNRPTHAFEMPERAVDKAMRDGRISAKLPFIKTRSRRGPEGRVPRPRHAPRRRSPPRSASSTGPSTRRCYQSDRRARRDGGRGSQGDLPAQRLSRDGRRLGERIPTTSATRTSWGASAATTASTRAPTGA